MRRTSPGTIPAPCTTRSSPSSVGGTDIGLDEALRGERHAFEMTVSDVTTDHVQRHLDEPTVRDA
jgi:hypothetical protein